MDLDATVVEAIVTILGAILTVVISYAGVYAGKYFKNSNLEKVFKEKRDIVDVVVKAGQQIFELEQGPEKFEYAKDRIIELGKEHNLEFTDEELKNLIESRVYQLKQSFSEGYSLDEEYSNGDVPAIVPEEAPTLENDCDL